MSCFLGKNIAEPDSHDGKIFGDARENIELFNAGASTVDTWRVDDHDASPSNRGLDDVDLAGARLEPLANHLLL